MSIHPKPTPAVAGSFLTYDPGSGRCLVFVPDASNDRVMIFEGSFMPSWPSGYE